MLVGSRPVLHAQDLLFLYSRSVASERSRMRKVAVTALFGLVFFGCSAKGDSHGAGSGGAMPGTGGATGHVGSGGATAGGGGASSQTGGGAGG